MDGEHAEDVKHAEDYAEGKGRSGPEGKALKGPKTPKAPQKWSELKRSEKAYITAAAVREFDAYVAEHGNKPYSRILHLVADEVCGAVRENGITLPKKIMEWHVVKIMVKLAKGGSRLEISTRRAMKRQGKGAP
jgi:hypothetical protein